MAAQLQVSAGNSVICALLALISAPASAEVLFDSLGGATSGSFSNSEGGSMDATFATGASTFDATDIALKIGQTAGDECNTVTVKLVGGGPLADLSFVPALGLNVFPGGAPVIASHTFAISDLSTGLTVEHFNELAGIPLKPNSLYWIDLTSTSSNALAAFVNWGTTSECGLRRSCLGEIPQWRFVEFFPLPSLRREGEDVAVVWWPSALSQLPRGSRRAVAQ
jgi:hypothetical protein